MRKTKSLITFATAFLGGIANAADVVQNIDGAIPIFCRDNSGIFQPFDRTDLNRLTQSYVRQFGWKHSLHSTSTTLGYLVFSDTGEKTKPETIIYDVEPHAGGIALLHMHVNIGGKKEILSGTAMCWRTFSIVNVD